MSANIVIRGLPGDVPFSKLLNAFRMKLKKIFIRQFWIRDCSDMDEHYKQCTVELTSNEDARKARNYLNNMPFHYKMMEYRMEVYLDEESTHFASEDDFGRQKNRGRKRVRARSRSPSYSREASKLDMEIELLRKQRQVIEEERRLLMEQKKLEMIREYGPSASREFDDFEPCDDFEPPRKRRQPEPVPKRPRQKSPQFPKIPKIPKSNALPVFFRPCKTLITEMKPFIDKDTTAEEGEILVKLIRAAIRKDLAIALEDKEYMNHSAIVKLYRDRHPKEEDEAFVAKILANIRASYLTGETGKKIKGEKATEATDDEKDKVKVKEEKVIENEADDTDKVIENEADDTDKVIENEADDTDKVIANEADDTDKVIANEADDTDKVIENEADETDKAKEGGDKIVNDEQPKDIPDNGENETDAAVPDTSAVKPELDKTQELENPGENSSEVQAEAKSDESATVENTLLDEAEKENELLGDEEPKASDWAEQWSPQKDTEVTEDSKVQ